MKLFYRKSGNGPVLIILHGLFGLSDNWLTIARGLSDRFTVILPDLRNHGLSPHSEIHDYDSMSNDLYELAADLKFGKFFLAGHSMGGKTAVKFAIKWPEMINGLLIADISPFTGYDPDSHAAVQHHEILRTILETDLSAISSHRELDLLLAPGIKDERIRGIILKNLKRNPDNSFSWRLNAKSLFKNLAHLMEGIGLPDSYGPGITGFPVYFIRGTLSDYLPERDFSYILKIFPAAEIISIQGAGHWIHADKPEAVVENLLRFTDFF